MLKNVRCLAAVAIGAALATTPATAQSPAEPAAGTNSFTVFFRSTPAGIERVSLDRSSEGWTIGSTGQLSAPFGLTIGRFEVEYDSAWHPRQLAMDGSRQGRRFSISTSFADGSASNRVRDGDQEEQGQEPFAPASVVLPDYFFGSYEALAVRLAGTSEGDRLPVYVAPRGPTEAVVLQTSSQQLESAQTRLAVRIYRIRFENPEQALDAEIWVDGANRLVRVTLPGVGLDVVRQDVSLVGMRLTGVEVPGDVDVRVPVVGFSLAATITTPVDQSAPPDGWPTVVMVPGSGSTERDEHIFGAPIFGRLAASLADAGYLAVRYDRRGVGRSGGRPESAALDDYADDARAVVRYLEDRDDVDRDRIVMLAHGEGGWIALEAASREDRIAALVLLAAPGIRGSDLVLEQQQTQLARLSTTDRERAERTALQQRINDAVLGLGPWDDVPAEIRRQADTPWFRSFLEFDPADVMRRMRQPLLLIHGEGDQEIAPYHADRLHELAAARRRRESTVDLATIPGVNHVMMVSESGASPRYTDASEASIASEVTDVLTEWLVRAVPPDR